MLFFTRCFFLYPNFAKMSFLEKRGPPRAWELKRLFCGVFEYLETSSGSKKLPCRAVWQARLPRTSNRLQNNYSRDFLIFFRFTVISPAKTGIKARFRDARSPKNTQESYKNIRFNSQARGPAHFLTKPFLQNSGVKRNTL